MIRRLRRLCMRLPQPLGPSLSRLRLMLSPLRRAHRLPTLLGSLLLIIILRPNVLLSRSNIRRNQLPSLRPTTRPSQRLRRSLCSRRMVIQLARSLRLWLRAMRLPSRLCSQPRRTPASQMLLRL